MRDRMGSRVKYLLKMHINLHSLEDSRLIFQDLLLWVILIWSVLVRHAVSEEMRRSKAAEQDTFK